MYELQLTSMPSTAALVLDLGDELAALGTREQRRPSLGDLVKRGGHDVLSLGRHLALLDPLGDLSTSLGDAGQEVDDAKALGFRTNQISLLTLYVRALDDKVDEVVQLSRTAIVRRDCAAQPDLAVRLHVGDDGVEDISAHILEMPVSAIGPDGGREVRDEGRQLVVDALVCAKALDEGDLGRAARDPDYALGPANFLGQLDRRGPDRAARQRLQFDILPRGPRDDDRVLGVDVQNVKDPMVRCGARRAENPKGNGRPTGELLHLALDG